MSTAKNRWKGCCYLCRSHKDKRRPAESTPWNVKRQWGEKRRFVKPDRYTDGS